MEDQGVIPALTALRIHMDPVRVDVDADAFEGIHHGDSGLADRLEIFPGTADVR